ncbi:MAG: DUF2905 domain-containing protein [Armatimonadota bacterium]|nr:DUF2905 domain-containing protein [Armatimonadota bacterium]MDR7518045.1 DUF2905 domain-containing protein [Armatimonadota bacterium]MDR7550507.1 DUF2905 domain-containing protein [Armatimonadota bacterium]
MTETMGRFIILTGVVLIILGLVLEFAGRLPRLPGDIVIQRPSVTVFIPIGTMILVSLVLTILLNLLFRR